MTAHTALRECFAVSRLGTSRRERAWLMRLADWGSS